MCLDCKLNLRLIRRMVNKLRQALDANPSIPQTPISPVGKQASDISIRSSTKEFEGFLRLANLLAVSSPIKPLTLFVGNPRSLRRCPNLLEAKRLRNDIEANLRRTRLPGSYAEETPTLLASYIERLTSAKQVIDRRIGELGGQQVSNELLPPSSNNTLTLRDVLQQPGAMSFFMEFMDRRNRVILPQFFLTVEGLKDPLEESSVQDDTFLPTTAKDASFQIDAKAAQALRDDVRLLLSAFLHTKAIIVSTNILDALESFNEQEGSRLGQGMPKALYTSIRHRIFSAQTEIYDEMNENDWPTFQRSDLYIKAIAEMPRLTLHATRSDKMQTSVARARALSQGQEGVSSTASSTKKNGVYKVSSVANRYNSGRSDVSYRSVSEEPVARAEPNTPFKSDEIDFLTGATSRFTDNLAAERSPLFAEDSDMQASADSDLFGDSEAETVEQRETMTAIQEALTSILEDDTRNSSVARPTSPVSLRSRESTSSPPVRHQLWKRATSPVLTNSNEPNIAITSSRPLLGKSQMRGRTASDHSQQDGRGSEVDVDDRLSDDEGMSSSALRLATPGNLQLPAEIEKIDARIEKLKNQEMVLTTLLRKAELTGNNEETKILLKSIDALRREVSELSFQQRQFKAQADENKLLPGRTAVNIAGTTVGQSQGKEFALYLVEVRQLAEDGKTQISGWLVTRRFSEFVALHTALKEKLPKVKSLDLPQKRIVTSMSNSLLHQRKQGLAKYLQSLITIPGALANRDVRAFLSRQDISLVQPSTNSAIALLGSEIFPGQGVIRNLFRTVTSGMDDMFGGPSMLDAIILRLSQQAADFAGSLTPSVQSEDLISSILGGLTGVSPGREGTDKDEVDLLSIPSDMQPVEGEGLTSFTSPIANFLVEVFDLKEKGSWLRRQAVVIILQQVLGGTIERKVREAVTISLSGDALATHINMLKELMWPEGKMRPPAPVRNAEDKLHTREAAFRKLTYLMPGQLAKSIMQARREADLDFRTADVAASLIGRSNARRGARRVFAMIQNRRLLQHLIYTLLDDVSLKTFILRVRSAD